MRRRKSEESGAGIAEASPVYPRASRCIREALAPYPDGLTLVTKVGALRGADTSWRPAMAPAEIVQAVHDNLRRLGLDALDVVNLRVTVAGVEGPTERSVEEPVAALAELQRQGLVRHVGMSNVTAAQVAEARGIVDVVCVQNKYNLAHRGDDALVDALAADGIAYVPFFPLGGYSPVQSAALTRAAEALGATPQQVALAWLLQRSPNILPIPGTSSVEHLRENVAAADLLLPPETVAALDAVTV